MRIQDLFEASSQTTTTMTTTTDAFEDAFDAAFRASGFAGSSHLNLSSFGPQDVEITHIGVRQGERGKGIGNALMGMVTELADAHGITLYASPATDADGEQGLDYEGLRDWYTRWNFEKLSGRDLMRRDPFASDEDSESSSLHE